jgi:CBS-domain-containing membrane protein
MTRDYPTVPRQLTIKELVQGQLLLTRGSWFLVTDGERVEGFLTLHRIKEVPREKWDITTVGQAMMAVSELKAVKPSDDAVSVIERMSEEHENLVTVVEEGRILGVILRDDLTQFASRMQSLRP